MKGLCILLILLLAISITTTYDNNILMAGVGTSNVGCAFIGVLFVLLSRDIKK